MPNLLLPCVSTTFLTKTSIYDASNNINAHFRFRCQLANRVKNGRDVVCLGEAGEKTNL